MMKKLMTELINAGVRVLEKERKQAADDWKSRLGEIGLEEFAGMVRRFTTWQGDLLVAYAPTVPVAEDAGVAALPIYGESACPICGRELNNGTRDIAVAADGRVVCLDCLIKEAQAMRAFLEGEQPPAETRPAKPPKQPETWADLAALADEEDVDGAYAAWLEAHEADLQELAALFGWGRSKCTIERIAASLKEVLA